MRQRAKRENVKAVPVCCDLGGRRMLRWLVRESNDDRPVTLEQALWPVNGIYEKPDFGFKGGECVSVPATPSARMAGVT